MHSARNKNWSLKELIGFKVTLYIVGGGHIGSALSVLIGKIGFYVVITNKYIDDITVLRQIINNNHKYIGVLGSVQKLKTMFEVLKKEGFTKTKLNNICAPVGLDIKSKTPYEIAVSIAAQIILKKNK